MAENVIKVLILFSEEDSHYTLIGRQYSKSLFLNHLGDFKSVEDVFKMLYSYDSSSLF